MASLIYTNLDLSLSSANMQYVVSNDRILWILSVMMHFAVIRDLICA